MPTESQQPANLLTSVKDRFRSVAIAPDQERKFPVGPENAKNLGYDASEVKSLPPCVTESFCGVGNPFSLGHPQPGQTVLDLGCGAGFDTLLASRRMGTTGTDIGVDMTPEMIAKARINAENLGVMNVELVLGAIEHLRYQTLHSIWRSPMASSTFARISRGCWVRSSGS